MGKPLLTDEIIAQARQNNSDWDNDLEVTKVMPVVRPSHERSEDEVEQDFMTGYTDEGDTDRIYKSRRIENTKRQAFQKKLNLILFVVFCLIALLIYAMMKL